MTPKLLELVRNIEARKPLAGDAPGSAFRADLSDQSREIYRNCNPKLGIDFSVDVLEFPGTQAFDVRMVRISPGANNELHKHAHESLFFIVSGKAEVRIGDETIALETGELAFVPRWVFHQSRNRSNSEPLTILAITDFGLTSAVLGDYDKRTRLMSSGEDAVEHV